MFSKLRILIYPLVVAVFFATGILAAHFYYQKTTAPPDTQPPIKPIFIPKIFSAPFAYGNNEDRPPVRISEKYQFTVSFPEKMDQASAEENFQILPETPGKFSWGKNILTFSPSTSLTKNEKYYLTVNSTIKNIKGVEMGEDYLQEYLVVGKPQILLMSPQGEIENQGKISIVFDRPMTELKTLDELDNEANLEPPDKTVLIPKAAAAGSTSTPPKVLRPKTDAEKIPETTTATEPASTAPPPKIYERIKIEPRIEGKWRWAGTTTLQFWPYVDEVQRFPNSLSATITIPPGIPSLEGSLLPEESSFSFQTPRIELLNHDSGPTITYDQPYQIRFNQNVDLTSVKQHFKITPDPDLQFKYQTNEYKDKAGETQTRTVKSVVEIIPEKGFWNFDSTYEIQITKEIQGLEGNLYTQKTLDGTLTIKPFISNIQPSNYSEISPTQTVYLWFAKPINLENLRQNLSTKPTIDFEITYREICNNLDYPNCDPVPDPEQKQIELTFNQPLKNETDFQITISKNLPAQDKQQYLIKDYIIGYHVAPKPVILDHTNNGNYKKFCLYSNNNIPFTEITKNLSFTPAINQNTYANVFQLHEDSHKKHFCYQSKYEDQYAIQISTLLNPSTTYQISLKSTAQDTYDQTFAKDYSFTYKTEALKDEDVKIAELTHADFAIVPSYATKKITFYAQNLNQVDVEICPLTQDEALKKNSYLYPTRYKTENLLNFCPSPFKTTLEIPNLGFNKSYFDVDFDNLIKDDFKKGFYQITLSSPKFYRFDRTYNRKTGEYIPAKKELRYLYKTLYISDLNIVLKNDDSGNYLAWITDFQTGQSVKGATVNFYDEDNNLVGTQTTDSDGLARFIKKDSSTGFDGTVDPKNPKTTLISSKKSPLHLFAKKDDLIGFLSVQGFGVHLFNQQKYGPNNKLYPYAYTDRPIYRPGQKVYFKGFYRQDNNGDFEYPASGEVTIKIEDSKWKDIFTDTLTLNEFGSFNGEFDIPTDAALGDFHLYTKFQGISASANFTVEEYKKPEFETQITTDKTNYLDHEKVSTQISGEYYFGGQVQNASVEYKVTEKPYTFDKYEGEWFSFDDQDDPYRCLFYECYPHRNYPTQILSGEADLDETGSVNFSFLTNLLDTSSERSEKTAKTYTISGNIEDSARNPVYAEKEIIAHLANLYVGIKNTSFAAKEGENAQLKVISVDPEGTPVPDQSITVKLYKVEFEAQPLPENCRYCYPEYEKKETFITEKTITSGGDGQATLEFFIEENQGGQYKALAEIMDERENFNQASITFYVRGKSAIHWQQSENHKMELLLDKPSYKVGETAQVLIQSPYQNVKALLTLERSEIMEEKIIDITSNTELIEIPIKPEHLPNVYVSVTEISGGDDPDFYTGQINIEVDPNPRYLNIEITPNRTQFYPGEEVTLTLNTTDYEGTSVPAEISIIVADQAVLALTKSTIDTIFNFFYQQRRLSVSTFVTLIKKLILIDTEELQAQEMRGLDYNLSDSISPTDYVTKSAIPAMAESLGIGGGGEASPPGATKKRVDFRDTAFFIAKVDTNSTGQGTVTFTLPDNLTTWNIFAIGATENFFGDRETKIQVTKDILVRPVIPRFLTYKDEPQLGAIIQNNTENDLNFTVSLESVMLSPSKHDNPKASQSMTKSLLVPANNQNEVYFQTITTDDIHSHQAKITLKATAEKYVDEIELTLPIHPYSTPETVATSFFTEDQAYTEKVRLPSSVDQTLGKLDITMGATLATYVNDSLNFLVHYPYGCTEQLMSSLLPAVVLKSALNIPNFEDKFNLKEIRDENNLIISFDTMVTRTLGKIYKNQKSDGGFGYWYNSSRSDPHLSAYVLYGLYHVQKAGYEIDYNIVNKAHDFLSSYLENRTDLEQTEKKIEYAHQANERAYLLFILSEIITNQKQTPGNQAYSFSANYPNLEKDVQELLNHLDKLNDHSKAYLTMTMHNVNSDKFTGDIQNLTQEFENSAKIDPRGVYFESYDYWTNSTKSTALILQTLNRLEPNHPLTYKVIKWLIAKRKNGAWSSTQDTVSVLMAFTEYLKTSKETEANYSAEFFLNNTPQLKFEMSPSKILDQFEVTAQIPELLFDQSNNLDFSKKGDGRLYYDIILNYYLPIDQIHPRDEGITIQREYYELDDQAEKTPITDFALGGKYKGKLIITTAEERNFVVIENFIPAGFELVNFGLATADQSLKQTLNPGGGGPTPYDRPAYYLSDSIATMPDITSDFTSEMAFTSEARRYSSDYYPYWPTTWNHKEMRDNRLLLFADRLRPGNYEYEYIVNVVNPGKYHHPPAVAKEMYFPEVFGRTRGEWIEIATP